MIKKTTHQVLLIITDDEHDFSQSQDCRHHQKNSERTMLDNALFITFFSPHREANFC